MNCNCSVANFILAVIIIVFALWSTTASQWIVVIAAALLAIHALMHKHNYSDNKKGK